MSREPKAAAGSYRTDLTSRYNVSATARSGWAVINGSIDLDSNPVCALLPANGQHRFSCDTELRRPGPLATGVCHRREFIP